MVNLFTCRPLSLSLSLSLSKLRVLFVLITLAVFHYSIFTAQAYAYNLRVQNASLYRSAAQPPNTIGIKFDLLWDGSFSSVDKNGKPVFDRAWVFVKYFNSADPADTAWSHATLIAGGTVGDYSSTTGVGISSDKKGAFCKPGANQIVYWNLNTDGLAGTENVLIKVMAIEMVYVPEGAFYVGSGGTETSPFYTYPNMTAPYQITSEAAIDVGTNPGNLFYQLNTNSGDRLGPIPAEFPKGYQSFYIMKYELSQGQYRDFLNMLTATQQAARCSATTVGSFMAQGNLYTTPQNRNGIQKTDSGFVCNLNNNGVYNEASDGEWIACNYLTPGDLCAYADWAGLRPMTELEFEKACRGPIYPVANEYAWGTSTIANSAYTMVNPGEATEGITTNYSTTAGNASWINTHNGKAVFRGGIFAANAGNTGRVTSGASYYGIMELSGNLWERPVTVGYSAGRLFTGTHGDGVLTTTNTDWPTSSGVGLGYRGGRWADGNSRCCVSDRLAATSSGTTRDGSLGFRLARTSP